MDDATGESHSRVNVVGGGKHVSRPKRLRAGGADQAPAVTTVMPPLENEPERRVAQVASER